MQDASVLENKEAAVKTAPSSADYIVSLPDADNGRKVFRSIKEIVSVGSSFDRNAAYEAIYPLFEKFIKGKAWELSQTTSERFDELVHKGSIGLLIALDKLNKAILKDGKRWSHINESKYFSKFRANVYYWVITTMKKSDAEPVELISLDDPVDDEEDQYLYEIIPDTNTKQADERVERVLAEVAKLPASQRAVIIEKYFHDKTFEEIGRDMGGISKQRVEQIEKAAIRNLRVVFDVQMAVRRSRVSRLISKFLKSVCEAWYPSFDREVRP